MKNTVADSTATGAVTRSQAAKVTDETKKLEKKSGGRKAGGKTKVSSTRSPGFSRKKKSQYGSFSTFIYRLLKLIHPSNSITALSMQIMNSMISDLFDRIATEASILRRINKRRTLNARDIQGAVKLIVRGELLKHAVNEGAKFTGIS